jgi:hypothetical protein
MRRESRRGKVKSMIMKQWLRMLHTENEDLAGVRYDWEMNNLNFESWAKKIKDKIKQRYQYVCLI